MNKKQLYAAPATEVLELHLEANVLTVVSPSPNPTRDTGYDEGLDW